MIVPGPHELSWCQPACVPEGTQPPGGSVAGLPVAVCILPWGSIWKHRFCRQQLLGRDGPVIHLGFEVLNDVLLPRGGASAFCWLRELVRFLVFDSEETQGREGFMDNRPVFRKCWVSEP